MTKPRPVRALPWTWHHPNGREEKCIALSGGYSRRIIIPAKQLREIADALHDRADEFENSNNSIQENMMTITEEQYDKLMIRAMTEERRARDAEARIEQLEARIGYLEHLLSIREEQLEQLRGLAKEEVTQ